MIISQRKLFMSSALALLLAACGKAGAERARDSADEHAWNREYIRLTMSGSDQAPESCGPRLRDVLGTRDLVQGALDGVRDPGGRAGAEIEDAGRWIGEADTAMEEIRPRLGAGACDAAVATALDQTWQYHVKAGTAAVQASQIAES